MSGCNSTNGSIDPSSAVQRATSPDLQIGRPRPTIHEVAHRPHSRRARARARAVLTQDPDHYELLDRHLIGQLAGVLYCCAGLIATVLLALNPPTHALGGMGWVPAGAITAMAFLFGLGMVLNRRVLGPELLLAIALSGPVMLGTLQWLAGSTSAYVQIIILSVVWCGVVLPGPRLILVLAVDSVMVFVPAAYGEWDPGLLPERLATIAIAWVLGFVFLVYAARQRTIRRELHGERQAADVLARVDPLTGLGNRRALDETLMAQVALAERSGRPLAALVGDLDEFKRINDAHGHHAGDILLRDVASVLRDVVRTPDACFRWGGDEFVILLAEVDEADARDVAARVASAVRERCHAPDGSPVMISLGTGLHVAGTLGTALLGAADADMLAAKGGRTLSSSPTLPR
jgi:diguanylate cyclase (GGDEF)-like protein